MNTLDLILGKSDLRHPPGECAAVDCRRRRFSRGFCKQHYNSRWWRAKTRSCRVKTCEFKGRGQRGLCLRHMRTVLQEECIFKECTRNVFADKLCKSHYRETQTVCSSLNCGVIGVFSLSKMLCKAHYEHERYTIRKYKKMRSSSPPWC